MKWDDTAVAAGLFLVLIALFSAGCVTLVGMLVTRAVRRRREVLSKRRGFDVIPQADRK